MTDRPLGILAGPTWAREPTRDDKRASALASKLVRLARRITSCHSAFLVRRGVSPEVVASEGPAPEPALLSAVLASAGGASPRTSELCVDERHDAFAYVAVGHDASARLVVVDAAPRVWTSGEIGALAELAALAAPLENAVDAVLHGALVRQLPRAAVLMFDRTLRYVVAEGEALLGAAGFSREELIGARVGSHAASAAPIDAACRAALAGETRSMRIHRDGRDYAVSTSPVRDAEGSIEHGLLFAIEEPARVADDRRDPLTGLHDRQSFLAAMRSRPKDGLLVFADLDGLKTINDTFGHAEGDHAIAAAAGAIQRSLRPSDVAARFGGDEFVAYVESVCEPAALARRIRESVRRIVVRGRRLDISVGVVRFTLDRDLASAIDDADREMYRDKKRNRPASIDAAIAPARHRFRR